MKKSIILLTLSLLCGMNVWAQLRVNSEGSVYAKRTVETMNTILGVGPATYNQYYNYNYGIHTWVPNDKSFNIAIYGASSSNNEALNTGRTFGVYGCAGKATNGYNYGVFGYLYGNKNGAGVVGTIYDSDSAGMHINGKYAGYFSGETRVDGTMISTSLVNPSDIRLKDNIVSLSTLGEKSSTLDNVLGMNVISYNNKSQPRMSEAEGDTARAIPSMLDSKMDAKRHYGLSAQELQTIYPDLVETGQDGYLAINYIELVPILIRSIQELKAELDEVKGFNGDAAMSRGVGTAVSKMATSGNVLYQNTPNPFKEQTTIRFKLADNVQNAAIYIFDMAGKLLKRLPISSDETSVSINGWELGEGMFLYTLMVNRREIETKRMIISK